MLPNWHEIYNQRGRTYPILWLLRSHSFSMHWISLFSRTMWQSASLCQVQYITLHLYLLFTSLLFTKNAKHPLMFHCLAAANADWHTLRYPPKSVLVKCSMFAWEGPLRELQCHCCFMAWQLFNAAIDHLAPWWYLPICIYKCNINVFALSLTFRRITKLRISYACIY
jgi:hypothetical protein